MLKQRFTNYNWHDNTWYRLVLDAPPDGERVIAPAEEKFYPAVESLRWRAEHLTTSY
ncbi:MAG TPA: hypothetical protein VN578_17705 [Candidatus Binatia bacterium]|jgi:hypothetical protein|nr:hypothetical protein [Candidatus Binatia bacterium]